MTKRSKNTDFRRRNKWRRIPDEVFPDRRTVSRGWRTVRPCCFTDSRPPRVRSTWSSTLISKILVQDGFSFLHPSVFGAIFVFCHASFNKTTVSFKKRLNFKFFTFFYFYKKRDWLHVPLYWNAFSKLLWLVFKVRVTAEY